MREQIPSFFPPVETRGTAEVKKEKRIPFSPEIYEQAPHMPFSLRRQEIYRDSVDSDERGFAIYAPEISVFAKELAETYARKGHYSEMVDEEHAPVYHHTVRNLIMSLGRLPEPEEVERELFRNDLLKQPYFDAIAPGPYKKAELDPQQSVIASRAEDFPAPEDALAAFENGKVRIEKVDGVTRLIITVPNMAGKMVDHPVMTDEEIKWVEDSALTIANSMKDKKNGKVFIAGLGLGLLNRELGKQGVNNQVVGELNHDVIKLVGGELKTEKPELNLDLRQGDFKKVLQDAIDQGELFDAISIDAFPNTAEEVNRDASSKEVLELAFKALKPGGLLTFYPDSRYLPRRILSVFHQMNIPDTSINYSVSVFKTSEFTKSYHYGDLMAVPAIQKPLLADENSINKMVQEYYTQLDEKIETYVKTHLS